MSLLRQVLKRQVSDSGNPPNGGQFPKPGYAASIRSVSTVKTIAASIASFYSAVTLGGTRVPKRRRPPKSELGIPVFTSRDPPPPELPLGLELGPPPEFLEVTHVVTRQNAVNEPKLSLLTHGYDKKDDHSPLAVFSNNARISGEVRLLVTKPERISSIDVWIGLESGCSVVAVERHIYKMHANIWNPSMGDPRYLKEKASQCDGTYNEPVQPGTYIFRFVFEPLPSDIQITQEEKKASTGRGLARVLLPPSYNVSMFGWSGRIRYEIGVDILRKGFELNDNLTTHFTYLPRYRAILPKEELPEFPFIPAREDWPFERELLGGWSVTPFGGRGRWNAEMKVEIEGLLGIRHPSVVHPGDDIEVVMLLWCPNAEVLKAIATPESVQLSFIRTSILGVDALSPSSRARKNRRVWPARECGGILRTASDVEDDEGQPAPSINQTEGEGDDSSDSVTQASLAGPECVSEDDLPPSPTDSEGIVEFPGMADDATVVKLRGTVPAKLSDGKVTPSFRYKNMAAEYLVHVLIQHKSYNHISPFGPGIEGEAPIWVVSGPRATFPTQDSSEPDASLIPPKLSKQRHLIGSSIVPLSQTAYRAPEVLGRTVTDGRVRSTWDPTRVAGI